MNEIKLNIAKQANGRDGPACLSQRGKIKEIRIVANHLAVTERPSRLEVLMTADTLLIPSISDPAKHNPNIRAMNEGCL